MTETDNPFYPYKDAGEYTREVLTIIAPTLTEQVRREVELDRSLLESIKDAK